MRHTFATRVRSCIDTWISHAHAVISVYCCAAPSLTTISSELLYFFYVGCDWSWDSVTQRSNGIKVRNRTSWISRLQVCCEGCFNLRLTLHLTRKLTNTGKMCWLVVHEWDVNWAFIALNEFEDFLQQRNSHKKELFRCQVPVTYFYHILSNVNDHVVTIEGHYEVIFLVDKCWNVSTSVLTLLSGWHRQMAIGVSKI